jgi:hypothetical protein
MTEPDEDLRPASTEEAADVVRNDPALGVATQHVRDDEATDDDARTPDQSRTSEERDA